MNQLQYKRIEIFLFCQPNKLEYAIKKFFNFFDVADGMILCGRNVAFAVWEGRILIESETMAKNKGNLSFSLNYPENRQKNGTPGGIRHERSEVSRNEVTATRKKIPGCEAAEIK